MTEDEQSRIDAIEADRRKRERELLALLLLLCGQAERYTIAAVRLGHDPVPTVRDVIGGNPDLDLPGGTSAIAEASRDAFTAGYRRAARQGGTNVTP